MKTFKDYLVEFTTTEIPNAKKGVIYKVTSNGKPEALKAKNKKELDSYLGYSLSDSDWNVLSKLGHLRVAPTVELLLTN